MRVVIMGCGRVGSRLATMMDSEGHDVTVLDTRPEAFLRLTSGFRGNQMLGDGSDEEMLRAAGTPEADVFVAVTQGDNRNIMASQIAKHILNVPRVVTRIYDPLRQEIFRDLGLETYSPTTVLTRMIHESIEE